MPSEIVLIGPVGAGKTTVAELLARRYGVPSVRLDRLSRRYYAEIGFDAEKAERLRRAGELLELYRYTKPFEVHAVERVLASHRNCVFDFGAGHAVQDGELFERVRRALDPYDHVVLLLPSPDAAESVRVLKERERRRPRPRKFLDHEFDFVAHWVEHPASREVAKLVVYTRAETPEVVAGEIAQQVRCDYRPTPGVKVRRAVLAALAPFLRR